MTRARLLMCALIVPALLLGAGQAGAEPTSAGTAGTVAERDGGDRNGAIAGRGEYGHRAQTTVVRYGPFAVPAAMSADHPGMISNAIIREGGCRGLGFCLDMPVEKPCEDCYITEIVPNLVDATTGETINYDNGGMLHHVVNVNWSRPDATCAPGAGGGIINLLGALEGGNDRFFATGNERTLFETPQGYGLPVRADDDWGLIIDLMNMTTSPRDMALEYTFTWVPDTVPVKPLTPVWLDIDNCRDSEVDLPHGYSDTEWDWTSTISGKVMALAGHVHDNGLSIAAENVTRGKEICTSLAGYPEDSMFGPAVPGSGSDPLHPTDWWHMTAGDHPDVDLESYQGHVAGATGCMPREWIREGDTIRLHTQYGVGDHGHGHGGQMGIMVAYVHER